MYNDIYAHNISTRKDFLNKSTNHKVKNLYLTISKLKITAQQMKPWTKLTDK